MEYRHYPFEIKVSTLSPLHIGNGEYLSSTGEYLTTSDTIYFLKHRALMQKLKEEEVFDAYLEKVIQDREEFDFYEILKNWSIDPLLFKEREITLHQSGLDPASNNILHLHIKTNEQVYIPGSTIKGLLRHAMIVNQLQKDQKLLNTIDSDIQRSIEAGHSTYQIQQYWTRKEREILDVQLFQMLQCADSTGLDDESIAIYQIQRQSMTGLESEGLDWLEECIAPRKQLSFELTFYLPKQLDLKGSEVFQAKSPKALFSLLNNWTKLVLSEELNLIENSKLDQKDKAKIKEQLQELLQEVEQANDEFAIARMGKGKTIFFQTLFPLLSAPTKQLLIDLISKSPTEVFPASRVLTVKDRVTKGWIKLEYHKPERKLFDNKIKGDLKEGMELQAYWVKKKTVEFVINGQHYQDVQLVNKLKQPFEVGQLITVLVHQVTNDNKINQVKVK